MSKFTGILSGLLTILLTLTGCQVATSQLTIDENGAASVLRTASKDGPIPVKVFGAPTAEDPNSIASATLSGLNRGGARSGLTYGLKATGVAAPGTYVLVYYDPPVSIDYDAACREGPHTTASRSADSLSAAIVLCGTPLIRRAACSYSGLCTPDKAMRAVYFQTPRPSTLSDTNIQKQLASAASDLAEDQNNKDPRN